MCTVTQVNDCFLRVDVVCMYTQITHYFLILPVHHGPSHYFNTIYFVLDSTTYFFTSSTPSLPLHIAHDMTYSTQPDILLHMYEYTALFYIHANSHMYVYTRVYMNSLSLPPSPVHTRDPRVCQSTPWTAPSEGHTPARDWPPLP